MKNVLMSLCACAVVSAAIGGCGDTDSSNESGVTAEPCEPVDQPGGQDCVKDAATSGTPTAKPQFEPQPQPWGPAN